ncbi:MAG TPA: hypothetical protein VNZ52_13640 [Candidatus Thermoplasmatota archaeon]|nr:hypothetical protein [Candidatus Thermoplasmatota archaeon]
MPGHTAKGRWLTAALLGVFLCLAGPAAAEAVTGNLVASPPLSFEKGAEGSFEARILTLTAGSEGFAFTATLVGERIEVRHMTATYIQAGGVANVKRQTGETEASATYGPAAQLTFEPMTGAAWVGVYPTVGSTLPASLQVPELAGLSVRSAAEDRLESSSIAVESSSNRRPSDFVFPLNAPHLNASMTIGVVRVEGNFSLFVWETLLEADAAGARDRYPTGERRANETPITSEITYRWVTINVTSGRFEGYLDGGEARLYAASAQVVSPGTARLPEAKGAVESEGGTYVAKGDTLVLTGSLTYDLSPETSRGRSLLPGANAPPVLIALHGDLQAANVPLQPRSGSDWGTGPLLGTPTGQAAVAGGAATLLLAGVGLYVRVNRQGTLLHSTNQGASPKGLRVAQWEAAAYAWERRGLRFLSPAVALWHYSRLVEAGGAMAPSRHRHGRARANLALGRRAAAVRDLRVLAALHPGRDDVRLDLARALARDAPAEALRELEAALRIDSQLAEEASKDPLLRALLDGRARGPVTLPAGSQN